MSYQEDNLLTGLKHADVGSFNRLYEQYSGSLFGYCYAFTKSTVVSEEIVSDVFIRLWQIKNQVDPDRPIKPLLLKITRDFTWNYLKKVARRKQLTEKFVRNYQAQNKGHLENGFFSQQNARVIDQALTELSPQQKKVFVLRYFKGKDLSDISTELSISKNTVKVHLARAKQYVLHYFEMHSIS